MKLPDPHRVAPVKATDEPVGENWPVVFPLGNSSLDGKDWHVATDEVPASAFIDLEFPGDPKTDAQFIAALINRYREGRLVFRDDGEGGVEA